MYIWLDYLYHKILDELWTLKHGSLDKDFWFTFFLKFLLLFQGHLSDHVVLNKKNSTFLRQIVECRCEKQSLEAYFHIRYLKIEKVFLENSLKYHNLFSWFNWKHLGCLLNLWK